MEEIKVDFSALKANSNGLSLLNYFFTKSKIDGVQVGVTWNQNVYEYLFETDSKLDLEHVLGYDVLDIDMQESVL